MHRLLGFFPKHAVTDRLRWVIRLNSWNTKFRTNRRRVGRKWTGRFVSQPRFQFSIGFLVKVTACCAVVFALLRMPAAIFVAFVLSPLPGFMIGRRRGGTGIAGGIVAGLVSFVAFGTGIWVYECVIQAGWWLPVSYPGYAFALAAYGSFWGAFVSILFCVVIGITKCVYRWTCQKPLKNSDCGPIVWRGFEDDRNRAPR